MSAPGTRRERLRPVLYHVISRLSLWLLLTLAVAILAWNWRWDWFAPPLSRLASRSAQRPVHIGHLGLRFGSIIRLTVGDVMIGEPAGFADDKPFLTLDRLTVDVDLLAFLHSRAVVIRRIDIDRPAVEAVENQAGAASWDFPSSGGSSSTSGGSGLPQVNIGELHITDGTVHVAMPALRADFVLRVHTQDPGTGPDAMPHGSIVADVDGHYAAQPVSGEVVGGALLQLRQANDPYPIRVHLANGATHIALDGTVDDPLQFAGTKLRLALAGADMAALFPLTGIPLPHTPPYHVTGNLDVAGLLITFRDFAGTFGHSDLGGNITVDRRPARPLVTADLLSHRVDLLDLGGLIGATPVQKNEAGTTPQQREAAAAAAARPTLLPNTPIDLPKLRAADVRLHYRGEKIEGRFIPLDNLQTQLDITDGRITLLPLTFGIGRGQIISHIILDPVGKGVHAKVDIDFRKVDLARIMAATHLFHGDGVIGGSAKLDGTGGSIAQLFGHGNGEMQLFMTGGNLSALLVDLSGFEFGNALLSALGVPDRATIKCMASDFPLRDGTLYTELLALDTSEAEIDGSGLIDLRNEHIAYRLHTRATHMTIGSLPAPIDISGTLKHPSIQPDYVDLGIRGGIAAGLGLVFAPLALLPTIQLGLGDGHACDDLLKVKH